MAADKYDAFDSHLMPVMKQLCTVETYMGMASWTYCVEILQGWKLTLHSSCGSLTL